VGSEGAPRAVKAMRSKGQQTGQENVGSEGAPRAAKSMRSKDQKESAQQRDPSNLRETAPRQTQPSKDGTKEKRTSSERPVSKEREATNVLDSIRQAGSGGRSKQAESPSALTPPSVRPPSPTAGLTPIPQLTGLSGAKAMTPATPSTSTAGTGAITPFKVPAQPTAYTPSNNMTQPGQPVQMSSQDLAQDTSALTSLDPTLSAKPIISPTRLRAPPAPAMQPSSLNTGLPSSLPALPASTGSLPLGTMPALLPVVPMTPPMPMVRTKTTTPGISPTSAAIPATLALLPVIDGGSNQKVSPFEIQVENNPATKLIARYDDPRVDPGKLEITKRKTLDMNEEEAKAGRQRYKAQRAKSKMAAKQPTDPHLLKGSEFHGQPAGRSPALPVSWPSNL